MKLVISNIAWTNEDEALVAETLRDLGVKYVEVAPTKLWEDPTRATREQIENYKAFWRSYGIEIVAFQSMLFTRPDLKLFESADNRENTLKYLKEFIGLAGDMGVKIMVFGSPKNRQRGEMDQQAAVSIATQFFSDLGHEADKKGVTLCIEPNAPQYACDFVTGAQEGIDLVSIVDNPGFGLHLDIACMTLAGDDLTASITAAAPVLRHFHISSPMLDTVEARADVDHVSAAKALKAISYDRFVSIEMRPSSDDVVLRVKNAVKFARSVYV